MFGFFSSDSPRPDVTVSLAACTGSSAVLSLLLIQGGGKCSPSASDSRSDGPYRAGDHVCRVRVRKPNDLREDECFSLLERECFEQLDDFDHAALIVGSMCATRIGVWIGTASVSLADVLEAHVSCDTQGPRHDRTAFPTVKIGNDPRQRLLSEVVSIVEPDEVNAEAPDVALNDPDEPVKGIGVTAPRLGCEAIQILHVNSLSLEAKVWRSAHTRGKRAKSTRCVHQSAANPLANPRFAHQSHGTMGWSTDTCKTCHSGRQATNHISLPLTDAVRRADMAPLGRSIEHNKFWWVQC